jgi:hypothetical protein
MAKPDPVTMKIQALAGAALDLGCATVDAEIGGVIVTIHAAPPAPETAPPNKASVRTALRNVRPRDLLAGHSKS